MSTDVPVERNDRLRAVPLLVTILLALVIIFGAPLLTKYTNSLLHLGLTKDRLLPYLYVHHAWMLILALGAIAVVKRFVPADYGLHLPRGKSYVGYALFWGVLLGAGTLLIGVWHGKPDMGYPLTPANISGWLFFEGVYVGPTEEIPFRALLVSYLAATMPGRIARVGWVRMNLAGVICALIFALAHLRSFFTGSPLLALEQVSFALLLGLIYAWLLERSRSVLAPAIAHNAVDFTLTAWQQAWAVFG